MKQVRWAAIVLLFFTGVSGVIGAVPMIADPHGRPWQMPQSLLRYSPFHSYLIPGIVLFCAIGILALAACAMVVLRRYGHEFATAFAGCVLFGWIVVECLLIRMVVWPHYLYGAIGAALMACGAALARGARLRAADRVLVTR